MDDPKSMSKYKQHKLALDRLFTGVGWGGVGEGMKLKSKERGGVDLGRVKYLIKIHFMYIGIKFSKY